MNSNISKKKKMNILGDRTLYGVSKAKGTLLGTDEVDSSPHRLVHDWYGYKKICWDLRAVTCLSPSPWWGILFSIS